MIIINSKNNISIRINSERLNHIIKGHPEMLGEIEKIKQTIESPEMILQGDYGELLAVRKYDKTPVSKEKYLIVAYKEVNSSNGFILTAYFSRKLNKRRKVLWQY
jgi:hypothetical protein